jgi:hypothetical protein
MPGRLLSFTLSLRAWLNLLESGEYNLFLSLLPLAVKLKVIVDRVGISPGGHCALLLLADCDHVANRRLAR